MTIKNQLGIKSTVLKSQINKYAILGLIISVGSILFATLLVAYQTTGSISLWGVLIAQKSNPAIWALDLTPFMFAYWGQAFCYELATKAETILEDKTRELVNKSGDLELKLRYESHHDNLTGLPNYRLLTQKINQGIKQIQQGEKLAVIILHITDFKDINYSLGSFTANNILKQFADKLKMLLLEPYMLQAYMGMNMVARLQSAEFAILIPRLKKEHQFEDLLTKALAATNVKVIADGNQVTITSKAGAALYPMHGDEAETLILNANASLLFAEKQNLPFAIYNPSMKENIKTNRTMLQEISHSIENESVEMLYTPEYALATKDFIGAEATINPDDVKNGMISHEKFVALIEGTSVVKDLTAFMLKEGIKQLSSWHKMGNNLYLTLNLFDAGDIDLPAFVKSLLIENKIEPQYLKIQFSEEACLMEPTRSLQVLNELSEFGVKIGISDFCSGYSSFIYLTSFPISEIKIDKSFIMNMLTSDKKLKVVDVIVKIANALHINAVAQGIVDAAIVEKLMGMDCMFGQGPYFSKALNEEDFLEKLSHRQTSY